MNTIADYTKDFSDGNKLSYEDFARKRCDWYNDTQGNLPYINCDICKNKGYIAELDTDLNEIRVECKCMSKRKSIKNLELSGLGNLIKNIHSMRMRRQNHGNRKSRKRRCYLRKIQAIHGFMQQDSRKRQDPYMHSYMY